MSELRAGALVWHPEHGHGTVLWTAWDDTQRTIVYHRGPRTEQQFTTQLDGWSLVGETGFALEGARLAWVSDDIDGFLRPLGEALAGVPSADYAEYRSIRVSAEYVRLNPVPVEREERKDRTWETQDNECDYDSLGKRLQRLRAESKPQKHLLDEPDNHAFVEREDLAAVLAELDRLGDENRELLQVHGMIEFREQVVPLQKRIAELSAELDRLRAELMLRQEDAAAAINREGAHVQQRFLRDMCL